MFSIENSHQFFKNYDEHQQLTSSWTMDKIRRKDQTVWVMNHFFINPNCDLNQELTTEMITGKHIAEKSGYPIWPLDPQVINYFKSGRIYNKFGIMHLLIIRLTLFFKLKCS